MSGEVFDFRDRIIRAYIAQLGSGSYPGTGSLRIIGGDSNGIYFRNSAGTAVRGLELDVSDHILVGGNSNPANLDFKANVQILLGLNSTTQLTLTTGVFAWGNTISTPILRQASISSADGQLFTVAAQATTGAHVGGRLDLAGGSGTASGGTGGDVGLSVGAGNGADLGNWYLGAFPASWQSMRGGGFVHDVVTAPTGNPTAGCYLYSSSGEPRWRTSGGRVQAPTDVPTNIDLTGQTATIAAANIVSAAPVAAMHELSVYAMCTTAGTAGDYLTVTITWSDPGGARTANVIVGLDLADTTNGFSGKSLVLFTDGSTIPQYATTVVKTGTPQYALHLTLRRVG